MMSSTPAIAADRRIYVISDLHLGDGWVTEPFMRKDVTLRRFLEQVAREADTLIIAGDGFDLAQAWTLDRIYRHHRALLDDLIALSRTLDVHYLQGNHDGSPEELARLLPFRYSPALTIGDRVRVEHGNRFDAKNQSGDRRSFWGARIHAHVEKAIRAPVRIPMRKHYRWSTRLGHWLFYRYGLLRRAQADLWRTLGRHDRARRCTDFLSYWGRGEWGDNHAMLLGVEAFLELSDIEVLVCGHSHQPGVVELPGGTYVNTGSWCYREATYARWDGERFLVRDLLRDREIGDEEYRGILGPHRDKAFFEWWSAFYRGRLRYDVEAMERAAEGIPLH